MLFSYFSNSPFPPSPLFFCHIFELLPFTSPLSSYISINSLPLSSPFFSFLFILFLWFPFSVYFIMSFPLCLSYLFVIFLAFLNLFFHEFIYFTVLRHSTKPMYFFFLFTCFPYITTYLSSLNHHPFYSHTCIDNSTFILFTFFPLLSFFAPCTYNSLYPQVFSFPLSHLSSVLTPFFNFPPFYLSH